MGFTLFEILIALFVFAILSLLLAGALRQVISAQTGAESKAKRLRSLQITLLLMSRDIEQIVNRSIKTASGSEEKAFIGTSKSFTLTHAGIANPTGFAKQSALQRTKYSYQDNHISRIVWPVLDQAPQTTPHSRQLISGVTSAYFEYLDKNKQFQSTWPLEGSDPRLLPRAIKVTLTISEWGSISQIYVLPTEANTNTSANKQP
jgi:general secretion pathway protein J